MTQKPQTILSSSRQIGFWATLTAVVPLVALAGPVHVKPAVAPSHAETPDIREFRDEYREGGPGLHAHGEGSKSAGQDDTSRLELEQRQGENQRCDRVVHSSGALRQIVLLDLASSEPAPFDFRHCKRDSPYASGGRSFEIGLLDVLRQKGDEPALESIYSMLNSGGDAVGTYSLLHYLAVRSSKNCLPGNLLVPLQKQMKAGSQTASPALEYHALLRLLNQVSLEHIRQRGSTEDSDESALQRALSTSLSGGNPSAVRRASIQLNDCFKKGSK